jgi:hypothetical protein
MLTCPTVLQEDKKRKTLDGNPSIKRTRHLRAQVGHNPKKKQIKRVFTNPITIKWTIVLYVGNILLAVLSVVNFVI